MLSHSQLILDTIFPQIDNTKILWCYLNYDTKTLLINLKKHYHFFCSGKQSMVLRKQCSNICKALISWLTSVIWDTWLKHTYTLKCQRLGKSLTIVITNHKILLCMNLLSLQKSALFSDEFLDKNKQNRVAVIVGIFYPSCLG